MTGFYKTLTIIALVIAAVLTASCASEPPETQKLYTDAQQMYNDFSKAFTLPAGQERINTMNRILNEEWDVKLVANLEQYLKDAPNGKYAKEAKALLDQAKADNNIRIMGQARPQLKAMGGIPTSPAEVDSMTKKAEQMKQQPASDTTKPSGN